MTRGLGRDSVDGGNHVGMLGPLWGKMGSTEMVLTGTFERTLDEKLRFALPKGLRQQFSGKGDVLYLTPGTDGSLALYPEDAFERLANRLAESSPTRRDVRTFSRLFYSQAQRCDLDRQGRIRISQTLAELAGLSREITLVGVRDYIEIWDTDRWRGFCQSQLEQYDAIAEQAFDMEAHQNPATTDKTSPDQATRSPR